MRRRTEVIAIDRLRLLAAGAAAFALSLAATTGLLLAVLPQR